MYTIAHAVVGYFFLLFTVRMLSRRPGGQLTPFEFVIVFLIGGIIIAATAGDDKSVTNCVCAIITIGLLHRVTARLRWHRPDAGNAIDGSPMVLLEGDRWQQEAMHHMRIDPEDVMATARTKGLRSLDKVQYAVLERVGSISILQQQEKPTEQDGHKPQDGGDGAKRG